MSEEAARLVQILQGAIETGVGIAEARAALVIHISRVERERDEARANYAFMVDKAAQREPTLDGYRELGARAADECAAALRADVLSVRPRLSELVSMDLIEDTGERRPNHRSGKPATVWRVKP